MYKIDHAIQLIRFSFVFWCFIACFFVGFEYLWIGLLFSLFVFKFGDNHSTSKQEFSKECLLFILFLQIIFNIIYFPSIFENSMFLSGNSVEKVVEIANNNVGKGRTIFELLTTSIVILPFILFDNIQRFKKVLKNIVILNLLISFIIFSGSSRGMLSLIFFTILIPKVKSFRVVLLIILPFIFVYIQISLLRDGEVSYLLGPFLDSFAIPGYLLGLLHDFWVERNVIDYISDVMLKFVPSFIYEKNIFSFNIEMTKIIYPSMKDEVNAISVFTYVGEMLVYKPVIITVVFSIIFIRLILGYLVAFFRNYNLRSTSLFVAIYFFIVLRSRVPDLISMLLLNLFVLGFLHFLNKIKIIQD